MKRQKNAEGDHFAAVVFVDDDGAVDDVAEIGMDQWQIPFL